MKNILKTRKHSSTVLTARLPTARASATRCQYQYTFEQISSDRWHWDSVPDAWGVRTGARVVLMPDI